MRHGGKNAACAGDEKKERKGKKMGGRGKVCVCDSSRADHKFPDWSLTALGRGEAGAWVWQCHKCEPKISQYSGVHVNSVQ